MIGTLRDVTTYRRLAYVLSALPLGTAWFVVLVTGWSLCLGFLVTPLVIPLLLAMAAVTHGLAIVEASVATALLDVEVDPRRRRPSGGFWARFGARFGAQFWKAQAYLWLRWITGVTLGVLAFTLLATALGAIFAPLWVPFVHGGAQIGFWRPHTFAQALLLVPAGMLLLPLTILAGSLAAVPFRSVAVALLAGDATGEERAVPGTTVSDMDAWRSVRIHAVVTGGVVAVACVIWLTTSRGYFWPIWLILPLALALGIHTWVVATAEQPALVERFRGSRALARHAGISAIVAMYFIFVWAISGHGYFWPIWIVLVLAVAVGAHAAAVVLSPPTELTERIETLETSRAGAVDLQESDLRRIERDLHDGAQARLVALGMSLGMAEQKLADDPAAAGALVAEARAGAEEALRELRDLARGIHPPVLSDRGLEAALRALISATPMNVELSVSVGARPAPAVETAAYFVVAEALANAAKYAQASRVDIRIMRTGDLLVVTIADNGIGGADPAGAGLVGLKRRVEALDGTLAVASPPGGPTTVRAELPCE